MASASNSKNIYCSNKPSSSPYTLSVSFTETGTNTPNNTSTISISGSIRSSSGANWESSYTSYLHIYWYDNRTGKETLVGSTNFSSIGLSSSRSVSGSIVATHNNDGGLSGYAKIAFTAGSSSGGWCPGSNSVNTATTALTTIPRASSISSISASALGSSATVNISRAVSTFTHKVEYKVGNSSWTSVTTTATTSATFTPPVSLASQYPNTTTAALYVRVTTYSGSTVIGSAVTSSKNVSIPTSVVPSFSSLSISRVDNGIPSGWGVYVKGYSKVTATISGAAGIYGSTIKSYFISGPSLNVTSSSGTSGVLTSAGTNTFTATITDSRGRTASKSVNVTVVDYTVPAVSLSAQRCNSGGTVTSSGTYLRVIATYSYASVSGKNTISGSIACNGVSRTSFSSGVAYVLAANCSIGSMYTATVTVEDGLGKSATATATIPTAERAMNFKKNLKAIGFGMFNSIDNTIHSAWPIYAPNIIANNGYLKSTFSGRTVTIGPSNEGYCHYSTTAPKHFFNTEVRVQGDVYAGSGYNRKLAYEDVTPSYKATLGSGVNLNTMLTNGNYIQTDNAYATTALNYPVNLAGRLEVITTSNFVFQLYHTYTNQHVYVRTYYGPTGWRAWRKLAYNDEINFTTNGVANAKLNVETEISLHLGTTVVDPGGNNHVWMSGPLGNKYPAMAVSNGDWGAANVVPIGTTIEGVGTQSRYVLWFDKAYTGLVRVNVLTSRGF